MANVTKQQWLDELTKCARAQDALERLGLPDLSQCTFNQRVDELRAFIDRAHRKAYPEQYGKQ